MPLNIGYLTCGRDESSDECMTPYYAVEPLIKHIYEFIRNKYGTCFHDITIWCPFDEEYSAYVNRFEQEGFKVIKSHIKQGGGFFLITNLMRIMI